MTSSGREWRGKRGDRKRRDQRRTGAASCLTRPPAEAHNGKRDVRGIEKGHGIVSLVLGQEYMLHEKLFQLRVWLISDHKTLCELIRELQMHHSNACLTCFIHIPAADRLKVQPSRTAGHLCDVKV